MPQKSRETALRRALRSAEVMQSSLDLTLFAETETTYFIEQVARLGTSLRELADDWRDVDDEVADRVRARSHDVKAIRSHLERLSVLQAEHASYVMDKIRQALSAGRTPAEP